MILSRLRSARALPAICLSLALFFQIEARGGETKPKYQSQTITLSSSHDYFRNHPAPDFWALMPYYTAQQDDGACSIASVAMAVNAARVGRALTGNDELVTQAALLKRVKNAALKSAGTPLFHGVDLDQLGEIVKEAMKAYDVAVESVEVVHVDGATEEWKKKIAATLEENEKGANDLIILNFNQKVYTGDTEVGHFSPLGAYDSKLKRALVMDVDRTWYEPYWVSLDRLVEGMATRDSASPKNRGYVRIVFKKS